MKKALLIAIICAMCNLSQAQSKEYESYLMELSQQFIVDSTALAKENKVLEEIKAKYVSTNTDTNITTELNEQMQKTREIQIKLDSIYTDAQTAISFYATKEKLQKEDLRRFFPHVHQISNSEVLEKEETKTYYYFGPAKVIGENDPIFKNKLANDVFSEILNEESHSYFGDFTVPKKHQQILLYEMCDNTWVSTGKTLKFQKVRLHIFEGSISDIQIFFIDSMNNTFLYENRYPVSLLRYTTRAPLNFIEMKYANSGYANMPLSLTESFQNYTIRLSDVLSYIPNPGNNYVPESLTIELPTKSEEAVHETYKLTYQVRQNTALQNIVELRTYTDFLGLLGDTPNGIVQLEGKADFYFIPLNFWGNVYGLKKISPFVNFSKLEENDRYVHTIPNEDGQWSVKNSLELLEKAYLQMGVNVNLVSVRFSKEVPFSWSLYFPAVYQISDIMLPENTRVSYKTLGLGGGLLIDFKRFNNFGFNYSAEVTKYNIDEFNTHPSISNNRSFLVFKNEAEVFYFPAENRHQAIFLRLKTFNNLKKGNSEAFYQLQFGYRFSVGVSKRN